MVYSLVEKNLKQQKPHFAHRVAANEKPKNFTSTARLAQPRALPASIAGFAATSTIPRPSVNGHVEHNRHGKSQAHFSSTPAYRIGIDFPDD
jgi:hypothetical protein